MVAPRESSRPASAEQRLKELGINLPVPPQPFGTYAEAVRTGSLLFVSGMLPTEDRAAKFIGVGIHSVSQRSPSDTFKAFGQDSSFGKKVCYQCHTVVEAKDYILTAYPFR